MLFRNLYAGQSRVAEPCGCPVSFLDKPRGRAQTKFHTDPQNTDSEAWRQFLALIDQTANSGRTEFAPGVELGRELWSQIVTLPPTIARLTEVRTFNLYGSNIRSIPPQIGEMTALEDFTPYTSHRLHWFPYEIVHCKKLVDSSVSTRALYGNEKYRPVFPKLPARIPEGSAPDCCSVCRTTKPSTELTQWWISLRVATDVLPLLAHVCSNECRDALGTPPHDYVSRPHQGGKEVIQPRGQNILD